MAANPRKTRSDSISLWHSCMNSESVGSCGTPDPISCVYGHISFPGKERSSPFELSPCESRQADTAVPRLFEVRVGDDNRKTELCCPAQQHTVPEKQVRSRGTSRVFVLEGRSSRGFRGIGRTQGVKEHGGPGGPAAPLGDSAPCVAVRNRTHRTKTSESFTQPRQRCEMAPPGVRHLGADKAPKECFFSP